MYVYIPVCMYIFMYVCIYSCMYVPYAYAFDTRTFTTPKNTNVTEHIWMYMQILSTDACVGVYMCVFKTGIRLEYIENIASYGCIHVHEYV